MDPRGLRARLTGADCTSCGAVIPGDRIAVLADRGDLVFVELSCAACGSQTLSVVLASRKGHVAGAPEIAGRPALNEADVLEMHRFLAGWDGDLRSMLDHRGRRPDAGASE